ncbi:hypothetical protein [Methanosarcina barkeri]|uniref:hypothetical protein n=1 Tax=Methanosarcina barkeri TaxID=2208 RepID=UPI0006D2437F|nr:hypothetical protein [Methanosarcina barkeri]
MRLKLGDYTYDLWGDYKNPSKGNINDGKNPCFWESPISYNADTPVTVEACSWEYFWNHKSKQILTVSTSTNSSNLKVLMNEDRVSDIPGFHGQDSIEDFVKGYIENGSIKLKENEAIYIFELGNTNLDSSGADFQDLVILVSVNGVETSQSTVESQNSDSSETPDEIPDGILDEPQDEIQDKNPSEIVLKLVIEHCGGIQLISNLIMRQKLYFRKEMINVTSI